MEHIAPRHFFWFFLVFIILELIWIQYVRPYHFSWKESLASLGVAIGHGISGFLLKPILLGIVYKVWELRLFSLSISNFLDLIVLFLGIEFFYYWYHRASHEISWLWVTHLVHHSPKYFNLSGAYRLGWTGLLSGYIIFFLPLIWIGFPPISVLSGISLNLMYQFWIHTELIPKLGIVEWVFNTPSHHRVHHGMNPRYLNCNYGGVLIIFDRLFGTFVDEEYSDPPQYGLTKPLLSFNPFIIAFYGWFQLISNLIKAKTWRDYYRIVLGKPT